MFTKKTIDLLGQFTKNPTPDNASKLIVHGISVYVPAIEWADNGDGTTTPVPPRGYRSFEELNQEQKKRANDLAELVAHLIMLAVDACNEEMPF